MDEKTAEDQAFSSTHALMNALICNFLGCHFMHALPDLLMKDQHHTPNY